MYFAYDNIDRTKFFAVKTIDRKRIDNDQTAITNMMREIGLMGEIHSPHVVSLMTSTKTVNSYYLVMELLNGGDLSNYVKERGGYLKEQEARLIIKQVVEGLTAIKKSNVMHRDLKLPNIMVNFSEVPQDVCNNKTFDLKKYIREFDFETKHKTIQLKIADLGFARRLQESELAETNCGTPLLMAPEILEGELYGHKADVWSLGCLFYEMLTGFPPFTGYDIKSLRANIRQGDY